MSTALLLVHHSRWLGGIPKLPFCLQI
ncbi:Protein of unknown function [Pyronema omphalodes CBS 100304]|uniref:Uncharacterized protein n=1 Tax=Pyronema omphalodes (strain CBS 100304) TaxID=1076935 RepID=U4KYQ2_PYROM|nr:Protein of unknown function [Pyronema omphalodes CBS 100304]